MKTLTLAALAVAAVALSGCNTLVQEKVLSNLQGCTRHYDGQVGAGLTGTGFVGNVKIDCTPAPVAPPA